MKKILIVILLALGMGSSSFLATPKANNLNNTQPNSNPIISQQNAKDLADVYVNNHTTVFSTEKILSLSHYNNPVEQENGAVWGFIYAGINDSKTLYFGLVVSAAGAFSTPILNGEDSTNANGWRASTQEPLNYEQYNTYSHSALFPALMNTTDAENIALTYGKAHTNWDPNPATVVVDKANTPTPIPGNPYGYKVQVLGRAQFWNGTSIVVAINLEVYSSKEVLQYGTWYIFN